MKKVCVRDVPSDTLRTLGLPVPRTRFEVRDGHVALLPGLRAYLSMFFGVCALQSSMLFEGGPPYTVQCQRLDKLKHRAKYISHVETRQKARQQHSETLAELGLPALRAHREAEALRG